MDTLNLDDRDEFGMTLEEADSLIFRARLHFPWAVNIIKNLEHLRESLVPHEEGS